MRERFQARSGVVALAALATLVTIWLTYPSAPQSAPAPRDAKAGADSTAEVEGSAAEAPPAPASLQIVAPRPTAILKGPSPIVLAGTALADSPTVEILVDGKAVARLSRPPFQTTFDFGDGLRSRTLMARIVSGSNQGMTTSLTTRRFDEGKIDQIAHVDLVTLYVTVRNAGGQYVPDLTKDQFRVIDTGQPQNLTHFGVEQRPLTAAIVIDCSFSMKGDRIDAARAAAIRFVKSLAPGDRAMTVAFSDSPRVLGELTVDHEAAAATIGSVQAKGGTALYDAIYTVAERLAREEGRKVMILLSDGHDEADNGVEPGSLHTLEEAMEKALRSEVILFTIGFGKNLDEEKDFYGRTSVKDILDRLARDSGGSSYFPQRASQLKSAYELIGEELRNQYGLAYAPKELRADGAWHPIRVDMADPAHKAFTRRGYYAPKR